MVDHLLKLWNMDLVLVELHQHSSYLEVKTLSVAFLFVIDSELYYV